MQFDGADAEVSIDRKHPEFSSWTWIAPNDLMEQIVPFKRDVYRAVFAAFEGRL